MVGKEGLFGFESGYAGDLRFMPMAIRYRSDLAGLKLGLDGWRALPLAARRRLLELAVDTVRDDPGFRTALIAACVEHAVTVPDPVPVSDPAAWSAAGGPPFEAGDWPRLGEAWGGLDDLSRYALGKLARSRREPEALGRALGEILGEG